jgi:hypothetical protein
MFDPPGNSFEDPLSKEIYTALPDGSVEVRARHGDVGLVRLAEDEESFTVVSGDVPLARIQYVKRALYIATEDSAS